MTTRVQAQAFEDTVIRPACEAVGLWSPAAGQLLLGTAIQESGLCHRRQIGGGPALGLFQIEPFTYADMHENYLRYRSSLMAKVLVVAQRTEWPDAEWLVTHDRFSAVIARIKYLRSPIPLPQVDDLPGMARYWSVCYNTRREDEKERQFIDNWHAAMGD